MNGEVLCKNKDQTTINRTRTSNNTVTQELLLLHTEVMAAVLLEHIILFERTFIEQHVNALASGVFAFVVLLLYGFLATTETSLFALLDELFDFL